MKILTGNSIYVHFATKINRFLIKKNVLPHLDRVSLFLYCVFELRSNIYAKSEMRAFEEIVLSQLWTLELQN